MAVECGAQKKTTLVYVGSDKREKSGLVPQKSVVIKHPLGF